MILPVILAVMLAVWYALHRVGAHLVFKPAPKRWPLTLPFQPVQIDARVTGVYLPAKPAKPTLLFFHGRGGNVSHFESFARTYAPLGYGVLLVDYRGFGLSAGKPSQQHMVQDANAAVDYALKQLAIAPEQLVIYGHSLGNFPALAAAQAQKDLPFKALILQSPFLTTPDTAAAWAVGGYWPHRLGYRLVRLLTTPFLWPNLCNNTRLAAGVHIPVLVCMSKQDTTLPWQASARLADYLPRPQRFLSPHGGHDEFNWAAPAVDKFLTQGHL